ncbi:MAG TPA: PKD domain-containing protein, partial [Vicinamibacterales bacterium]|nr:PKD domain-containing protein [Vicinamibacterales bacterium]
TYEWDFGDGTTATGAQATHTYAAAGTFTVRLTVRDGRGGVHTAETTAAIAAAPPTNQPPIARPGGPYRGTAGQAVSVDGSASSDPDGDALTYEWEFGDGTTATGATAVHTYAAVGSFTVRLTVRDGRGGVHDATAEVVIAPAPIGVGVIAGRVLDDRDGVPIEGAAAQLLSADGQPRGGPTASTDALGRFRLTAAPGAARILVTRDGYTSVERVVQVADGRRVDPLDVRLTSLAAARAISSVTGGAVQSAGDALRLEIPPGAMADDQAVRLTVVAPTGVRALPPLGWSPVVVADLGPRETVFTSAATLVARAPSGLPQDAAVVVAMWDEAAGAWIALGAASRSAGGKELRAAIARGGQYAFVLADAPPDAPPPPADGRPLEGVAPRAPPPDLQLTITPSPRILFARPDARSEVAVTAASQPRLPSGTPVSIDVAETFSLSGGRRLYRWPGTRTFPLHGVSAAALGASFAVGPSRSFAPFALRQGVIDLAARLPADPFAPRGAVVGPAGGEAAAATGERLTIPSGAAAEHLPVVLTRLAVSDLPMPAASGLSLLGGVLVDLHGGVLSIPATLSVPAPAGFSPSGTVLVVELVEAADSTRPALVAVGRLQGGAIASVTDVLGDGSLRLPGIRRDGRYALLQAEAPLGFLTGLVTGLDGSPLAGALVEIAYPVVAVSDEAGRYVLAGPSGAVELRATDLRTKDTTTAGAAIGAAGSVATASASLGPTPPFVAAVTPAPGAAGVPRSSVVSITFSEPVDAASVAPGAIALFLGDAPVAGAFSLAPGGSAAVFRPAAPLESDAVYRVVVAATIRDLAGHAMAAPFTSQFRTADETPPPRPAAGQIAATIPDASGMFELSGTQGTADPGGVVLVKNLRTSAVTTLAPNADGSFSGRIAAARSDRLELTIQDAAGNRTTVPVPPFRGADGSVVVGEAGGRVEGPGGVFVDIPAGAVPAGTVVKVAPATEAEFPLPAPPGYPFIGGVHLDLGGVVPREPLDLGVPAPPGATAQDQVIVARAVQLPRRTAWTVVDRAHLEDGRYRTASPPFVGIAGQGSYSFLSTQGTCVSYVTVHYQLEFHLVVTPSGLPWVFPATSSNVTTTPAVCDSTLQIQAVDPSTDLVIQQITEHAPAVRDEIVDSPQILTTDRRPPFIISAADLTSYRVDQVEIRFSEPMDAESVESGFTVEDSDGNVVPGTVELLEGGRLAVFRPTAPFRLGEQYSVFIFGATDLAGNFLEGQQLTFTPFSPRSLSNLGSDTRLRAALEKCTASGVCSTSVIDEIHIGDTLFMANGLRLADQNYTDAAEPKRLVVASVTDPLRPTLIGFHRTGTNPRTLAAVPHLAFTLPNDFSFAGDMLLVAGGGRVPGGELPAKLELYDVTACRARPPTLANCLDPNSAPLRHRFLSTVAGVPPLPGVPPESGIPLQMAVLRELQPDGRTSALIAYTLVTPIGIEAVDILKAFNLPQDQTPSVGPDGLVRGNFLDLTVLKNRLLALERHEASGSTTLAMFGADLSRMPQVTLPGPAARITAVENLVFDIDGDGNLGTAENDDGDGTRAIDEIFDLAVVSSGPLDQGAACAQRVPCGELYVVDLSPLTSLEHAGVAAVVARIPIQGPAFGVQIDPNSRTAYVEIRGRGLGIVDLGFLLDVFGRQAQATGLIDTDGNGVDDRVLRIVQKEDIVATDVRVDVERGIAYVNGAATGLELIQISNNCVDLRLDFRTTQAHAGDLAREQRLLLDTIAAVSGELRSAGIDDIAVLEQGSGSCFWRGLDTCRAFTPGSSDHDLEVFVPMSQVVEAQRILDGYIRREKKRLAALGLRDLTMFAMPKEPFVSAELLNGTPMNRSGDASGDLAMGRQSLLLLWLLEGEYVDDPNTEPIDYIGSLPSLDIILTRLREKSADNEPVFAGEPTGIPRLEGHEWALLQEFNFYKSGALVRIKGACDAEGALNSPTLADIDPADPLRNMDESGLLGRNCEDELRTVAKAAIRAAFARLVADDRTNAMVLEGRQIRNEAGEVTGVLELSRQTYRGAGMCLGTTTPRNAPADPFAYGEKPCSSFEEFIMSMVVESARRGYDVFPAGVYGADILPWIYRFYCVKVGRHCESLTGEPAGFLIESDEQANEFIAKAIEFIEKAKAATEGVYATTIANDTKPLADLVAPGAPFPFLLAGQEPGSDGIAAICAQAGVGGITLESTRADLRRCNQAVVKKKVEGTGTITIDPVVVIDRTETRKTLEKAMGVRRYVRKNLRVRAVNRAPHSVPAAILTMYEGDGLDTSEYQPKRSIEILRLGGSETRVIEEEPDPDRPGDQRPFFPTFFDIDALRTQATPSSPRAIAFFLDPERSIPEERKNDNQAAFFYYVLDRQNPDAVPSEDTPAFAIEDTSPDPLCIRPPPLKLDVTAKAAGLAAQLGVKELAISVAQQALLTYRVENLGTEPLENVVVERNGEPVFTVPELPPAGVEIRTEPFVSTITGTFDVQATALAATADGDSIGPEHDRVFIHVTAGNQLFDIQFFDHSPLREPTHPFSRFLANHDDEGKEVPLIGAVTDGSQDGAGGRMRVVIRRLKPGIPVDISIADGELTGIVDGVGWLEHGDQVAVLRLTGIMPDGFGEATVYYTPPPVFVREQHKQHDLARQERHVTLTVSQNTVGTTHRPILLRRPPVFLVHGLFSETNTWNRLQPLVPPSGVSLGAIPGYDGRFDLFAIGSRFASATFAREAEALKADIRLRLSEYLPGFSIGRIDIVGHSMGAVLIRRLANEFLTIGPSGPTGADPKNVPFRKLIALNAPFQGSPLADKIVEIRSRLPVDPEMPSIDLLSVSDDDVLTPELGVEVKLEKCAFVIQTVGLASGLTGGAVDDLQTTSAEIARLQAAGIQVPTHHIVGETAVPELGIGVLAEALWAALAEFCDLTPDSSTVEASIQAKLGILAAKTFVPVLRGLKAPKLSKGIGTVPVLKLSDNQKALLDAYQKIQGFKEAADSGAPTPVFSSPENDRVVEGVSQAAGLPADSRAVSFVIGSTDHNTILDSSSAPACGDLSGQLPPATDSNGDGTLDATCRVIYLLEADPAGPFFFRSPRS